MLVNLYNILLVDNFFEITNSIDKNTILKKMNGNFLYSYPFYSKP
jgi:hypothetical protein